MNWSQADPQFIITQKLITYLSNSTLVWGSQEPGWIGGLSNADKKAEEVEEWIAAAGTKYMAVVL